MKWISLVVGVLLLLSTNIHTTDTTIWDTLIVLGFYVFCGTLILTPIVLEYRSKNNIK